MQKPTEQNLIVRIGKSKVEVASNKRLHLRYCTAEANYWQTQNIAQPLCDNSACIFFSLIVYTLHILLCVL